MSGEGWQEGEDEDVPRIIRSMARIIIRLARLMERVYDEHGEMIARTEGDVRVVRSYVDELRAEHESFLKNKGAHGLGVVKPRRRKRRKRKKEEKEEVVDGS